MHHAYQELILKGFTALNQEMSRAECRNWGPQINVSKMEELILSRNQQSIKLENRRQMESCEVHKYLGVFLT